MPLAGDKWVAEPRIASTHAITINVGAKYVWPWLIQIGQDRDGFYSYTALENLLGCQMKNAEQIRFEGKNYRTDIGKDLMK